MAVATLLPPCWLAFAGMLLRLEWILYGARVLALVPLGAVALLVFSDPPADVDPLPVVPILILIVAVRAVDHSTFTFIDRQRPFGGPDATAASLASDYHRRFILALALTSGGTILGFAGAALTYEPWIFGISALAAIPAYVRDAPSGWSIRRAQADADANGAKVSVLEGLRAARGATRPYTPEP
jgi:hypothetical protein